MIDLFTAVIIFTSILVILRLASKLFIKKQLAAEDYIAALAQVRAVTCIPFPRLTISGHVSCV